MNDGVLEWHRYGENDFANERLEMEILSTYFGVGALLSSNFYNCIPLHGNFYWLF